MSQAPTPEWFRLNTIRYSDLGGARPFLRDFASGDIDGLIVEGVYPKDQMARLANRIISHDLPFFVFPSNRPFEEVRTCKHLYGITLVAAAIDATTENESDAVAAPRPDWPPSLEQYFDVAEGFRKNCRALFSDYADYDTRLREIFESLAGGTASSVARAGDGRIYMPATIRILPEGSGIDLHSDNNLGHYPSYSHLKTVCDVRAQLSHFLTISAPDAGGELIVYRRQWSADDDTRDQYSVRKSESFVSGAGFISVKPSPGDMIIFTGGRSYHSVKPARGPHPRITIGGFIAKALGADQFHYWS